MTIPFESRKKTVNVNISKESPLKELLILVGGLVFCIVAIYATLGLVVDRTVDHISIDIEKQLGDLIEQHWLKDKKEWKHQAELQGILDRLVKNAGIKGFEFQVSVVDSELINAIALPGGKVLFFKGLLERCKSENQIAAVLGHELGHYANRDHLRGLGRGIVFFSISVALTGVDSLVTDFVSRFMLGTQYSYSRGQEVAADEFGLELLQSTYGHVGGITQMFDAFASESEESGEGSFGELFETHPSTADRRAHIADIINNKGLSEALEDPLPWTKAAG